MVKKQASGYNFLIFIFAIMLIFQTYNIFFLMGETPSTWQEFAKFDFEVVSEIDEETGEEVTYKLISTPEQLAGAFMQPEGGVYADSVSDYFKTEYKLTRDIDLSGKTWNPSTNSAQLDGQYYTIHNLTINSSAQQTGFVSKNTGTIKNLFFRNLNVTNSCTTGRDSETGGVVGLNQGTIKNVVIKSGSVSGNTFGTYNGNNNLDRRTGGIAGHNVGGTISWCENNASVSKGKHIGGIVGKQDSGTIKLCHNYATVKCGPNVYPRVGGICGEVSGGTLTQCVNFGKMSNDWYGTGVVQHTDIRIGGIAGMASVNLSECGNYGEIYSSYQTNSSPYQTIYPKESYAGGIAGYSTGTIKNCFNTGKVYSKADTKTELVEDYQFNVKGEYKNVKTGTCYSASGGSLSSYNASAERVFMGGDC